MRKITPLRGQSAPVRASVAPMKGTALITGASAGLGRDYARLFAKDGHDVVLVARRRDRLEELARELAEHYLGPGARDRVRPRRARRAAPPCSTTCRRRGLAIDFLVNNAGFGLIGAFADADPKRELEMIQVNVTGLVELTRLFLPQMIARKSGRILKRRLVGGLQPGPFMATYYASKAFVNSFTEALAYELEGTASPRPSAAPVRPRPSSRATRETRARFLFKLGAADSASVASEGYRAMLSGQRMVVHGLTNKLSAQATRFTPRALMLGIAARLKPRLMRAAEPSARPGVA